MSDIDPVLPIEDPYAPPSALTKTRRPRALRFNPLTRDYDKDSEGRYVDVHPVDAWVVQQLLFAAGKIPAAPNVGQTYHEIRSAYGPDVQRDVENRTKLALKRCLDAGDISLVAIRFVPIGQYGIAIQVDYVNERLLPRKTQTATVPLG